MVTFKDAHATLCLVANTLSASKMQPIDMAVVGSTFICGEGQDIDILMLVPESQRESFEGFFEKMGYNSGGDAASGGNGDFTSMKHGVVNVIITDNMEFYDHWISAAHACRYIAGKMPVGWMTKEIRVDLHQIIADGRRIAGPVPY